MRRFSLAVALVCVAAAAIAAARSASADSSMGSASMSGLPKNHQYLIGDWSCDAHIAAMQGQPAMTTHGTMTIALGPTMTIHSHVAAKDYASDSYQGYNAKTKTHWLNSTDSQGASTVETSMDGMVFTGTTWQGGTSTPTRDTQTKISDTKIHDLTELKMNGKWTTLADVTCTK